MSMWRKYGLVYGISAIVAIFCSGCSSIPSSKQMSYSDINFFQMDCDQREQQIKMLQSMESTRDDRFFARSQIRTVMPAIFIKDPEELMLTSNIKSKT